MAWAIWMAWAALPQSSELSGLSVRGVRRQWARRNGRQLPRRGRLGGRGPAAPLAVEVLLQALALGLRGLRRRGRRNIAKLGVGLAVAEQRTAPREREKRQEEKKAGRRAAPR